MSNLPITVRLETAAGTHCVGSGGVCAAWRSVYRKLRGHITKRQQKRTLAISILCFQITLHVIKTWRVIAEWQTANRARAASADAMRASGDLGRATIHQYDRQILHLFILAVSPSLEHNKLPRILVYLCLGK